MTASWSGSRGGPTEYKVAARFFARYGGLPSDRLLTQSQHPSQAALAEPPLRRMVHRAVPGAIEPHRTRTHTRNPLDIKSPIQVPAQLRNRLMWFNDGRCKSFAELRAVLIKARIRAVQEFCHAAAQTDIDRQRPK
jgi:hypothetical protein